MMIGIHAVLLFAPSARYAAVDAVRSATTPSAARPIARRLLGGWGLALGLIGLVAVWLTTTHSWPMTVGIPRLQLSLGDYNLRGALFLVGIAAAMLAAAVLGWRVLALIAAAVAVAAAITIYIQFGRGGVWLGGTPSTAAVFVSAAMICLGTAIKIGKDGNVDGGGVEGGSAARRKTRRPGRCRGHLPQRDRGRTAGEWPSGPGVTT
jgi:hypothetical protein